LVFAELLHVIDILHGGILPASPRSTRQGLTVISDFYQSDVCVTLSTK
jgi:hypothetical protein